MALSGLFVGVDKYSDPKIRDLRGARKDATALWALFSDTLPDMTSRRLVDEEATVDVVRKALTDLVGTADADDVVIFSFAGHGTHEHQLVLHDSAFAGLDSTTLSMAELADAFKKCRARALVFILDCCFSGGASARVLADSPVARAVFTSIADVADWFVLTCNTLEETFASGTDGEVRELLRLVGSNYRLGGGKVDFEPVEPFTIAAQAQNRPHWLPG